MSYHQHTTSRAAHRAMRSVIRKDSPDIASAVRHTHHATAKLEDNRHLLEIEKRRISKSLWNDVEKAVRNRADNFPSKDQLANAADTVAEWRFNKAVDIYEQASLMAGLPGGDMWLQAATLTLVITKYQLYMDMYRYVMSVWYQGEKTFNHGQIYLTEAHILPNIRAWLDMAGAEWPDVEPEEYGRMVEWSIQDYPSVWQRAFTDITDEPMPMMDEFINYARACDRMLEGLGSIDFVKSFLDNVGSVADWLAVGARKRITQYAFSS